METSSLIGQITLSGMMSLSWAQESLGDAAGGCHMASLLCSY